MLLLLLVKCQTETLQWVIIAAFVNPQKLKSCCKTSQVTPRCRSSQTRSAEECPSVQMTVISLCYWVHVCLRWNSRPLRIRAHFRTRFYKQLHTVLHQQHPAPELNFCVIGHLLWVTNGKDVLDFKMHHPIRNCVMIPFFSFSFFHLCTLCEIVILKHGSKIRSNTDTSNETECAPSFLYGLINP